MTKPPTAYEADAATPITQPVDPAEIGDDRVRAVAVSGVTVKQTLSELFVNDPASQLAARYIDLAVQAAYGCTPVPAGDAAGGAPALGTE